MLTREDILNYALALPPGDRELVAVALQDSLEAERNPAESLAGSEFYEELPPFCRLSCRPDTRKAGCGSHGRVVPKASGRDIPGRNQGHL